MSNIRKAIKKAHILADQRKDDVAVIEIDSGYEQPRGYCVVSLDYCDFNPEFEAFNGEIIAIVEPNSNNPIYPKVKVG